MLRSLQQITVDFVKQVSAKKGLSQTVVNESGGKIFTFGSYRLGVFGPGLLPDQAVLAMVLIRGIRIGYRYPYDCAETCVKSGLL